jgi:NitT/TauT family transport system substrate-binding protein
MFAGYIFDVEGTLVDCVPATLHDQALVALDKRDKIGVPSVKVSVPAIYLQMEAERLFGTGKHTALDELTVSLSQPDGVISILSGGTTVNGYLFSPPFIQQLSDKPNVRRIWSSNELFGSPATALTTIELEDTYPSGG